MLIWQPLLFLFFLSLLVGINAARVAPTIRRPGSPRPFIVGATLLFSCYIASVFRRQSHSGMKAVGSEVPGYGLESDQCDGTHHTEGERGPCQQRLDAYTPYTCLHIGANA